MRKEQEEFLEKMSLLLDRLEPMAKAMELVLAKIERDNNAHTSESEQELIVIPEGESPPWVVEARKWMGLNEMDDRDQLEPFLGGNPDDSSGGKAWCAAFVNSVMQACDIDGTGSWLAVDFENWGQPCEKREGAIAVFGPGNVPGGHVGFVVNETKILGGNQGDMVRENNLQWYLNNKKLLGYRWPSEYQV